MTTEEKQLLADEAAARVGQMLIRLQEETGLPTDVLLAGAHAQLIAMMTTHLGGPMTAATCEQAAKTVRDLPSLAALTLAGATPAGRA